MRIIILFIFIGFSTNIFGQSLCDGHLVLTDEGSCNNNPFVLVFEDNFDSASVDLSKWNLRPGGSIDGTANQEYNCPEHVSVSDGYLYITATDDTTEGRVVHWKPDTLILEDGRPNFRTFYYTSANIRTRELFKFGKFEIRCKIAKGKGFWPAFWMFGGPGWNEVDVFEFWNENNVFGVYDPDKLSRVHKMNAHYDFDGDGYSENCPTSYSGPDFSEDFHTFSFIWTPYKMEWYVDGEFKRITALYHTIEGKIVDCNNVHAGIPYLLDKAYPQNPMNIRAGFGIQSYDNSPDESTPFPSSFEIDYIRYYKQIPCEGKVTITQETLDNLHDELFNVIIGTTIKLDNNLSLNSDKQLELIARDSIIWGGNFTNNAGAKFVTKIDTSICKDIVEYSDLIETKCGLKIYPNPNNGKFIIENDFDILDMYYLKIISENGQILVTNKIISNSIMEFDFSNYSNGKYFIKVVNANNRIICTSIIVKNE